MTVFAARAGGSEHPPLRVHAASNAAQPGGVALAVPALVCGVAEKRNYDVRELVWSDAHGAELCALLNAVFPETSFDPAYLEWQYRTNPAGAAVGYNAWFAGKLAAHYVALPVRVVLFGKETRGLLSLNTATQL